MYCSSLKCACAFQCEGLQNNHTSLKLSNFFATLHTNQKNFIKTWYWPFCAEYENNMISYYIEKSTCNKMMHKNYLDPLHNALNHHPTPKAKSYGFWLISKCPKILAQFIFSIGRPHNDTHINASNVSSFNWLMRSLFTQFCLKNPLSHIIVFAKLKLQSRNCKSYWKLEMFARVPRMESNYFFIWKFQPLFLWHIVVGETILATNRNFHEQIFVKCLK